MKNTRATCPRGGFSYGWDGSSCKHCRYEAAHPGDLPAPPQGDDEGTGAAKHETTRERSWAQLALRLSGCGLVVAVGVVMILFGAGHAIRIGPSDQFTPLNEVGYLLVGLGAV